MNARHDEGFAIGVSLIRADGQTVSAGVEGSQGQALDPAIDEYLTMPNGVASGAEAKAANARCRRARRPWRRRWRVPARPRVL